MSLESTEDLCLISLKIDKMFEGKLTCVSKNDMRKIFKSFHQSTFESLKIGTLMTSFCLNLKMYELKIYRGVLYHDDEEWCKIWRGIHFSAQTWHEEFDKFWPKALKNLKNLSFNGLFFTKVYNAWAKKKYREPFVGTEDWCKIWMKTDLSFLKWHEEFGKFSFTFHFRK